MIKQLTLAALAGAFALSGVLAAGAPALADRDDHVVKHHVTHRDADWRADHKHAKPVAYANNGWHYGQVRHHKPKHRHAMPDRDRH